MTAPSSKLAPMIGHKDRPGDPTQITVPPRGLPTGGTTDITDLDARILQVIEDALAAAGSGTAPVIDNTARAELEALIAANTTKITANTTKNTQQDTKIAALEAAGAENSLAIFGVADTAWTACTMKAGVTGTLSVRVWKGHVIFKGSGISTGRVTDQALPKPIAEFPASIRPPYDMKMPVTTWQTGSAGPYGTGTIHFYQSGIISVSPGMREMDGIYADGIQYAGAW